MKKYKYISYSILSLILANSAHAQSMNCKTPINKNDSAKSILNKYGKDAILGDINAPEGEIYKGVILYPNNSKKRAEIVFYDDEMKHPSSIQFHNSSSFWNVAGLKIGDSLEKAVKINKKTISMSGFDWD